MRRVWVVQDRESGMFLAPLDGDVGFVARLKEAGGFEDYEAACECAVDHCGEGADVVDFWTDQDIGRRW